jgi:hypothetical protein
VLSTGLKWLEIEILAEKLLRSKTSFMPKLLSRNISSQSYRNIVLANTDRTSIISKIQAKQLLNWHYNFNAQMIILSREIYKSRISSILAELVLFSPFATAVAFFATLLA